MSAKIVEQKIPSQNQSPLNANPPKKLQKIILKFQMMFHLSNMFKKSNSGPCNLSTTPTPGQRTDSDTRLILTDKPLSA
jgi:hypothetical protein